MNVSPQSLHKGKGKVVSVLN